MSKNFDVASGAYYSPEYRLYNPNLLINGDFSVWQRGTSVKGLSGYGADCWYYENANEMLFSNNGVPQKLPDGKYYYIGAIHTPDTTTNAVLSQFIEARDARILRGQRVTLSFWCIAPPMAYSDTLSCEYALHNMEDDGSSETANPRWMKFDDNVATIKGWTKVVKSATIPEDFTGCFRLHINFTGLKPTMTNAHYVLFAGMKLELGDIATEFVPDDAATNLAKCQRYFYKKDESYMTSLVANSTTGYVQYIPFPVSMRVPPTITFIEPNHVTTSGNWGAYGTGNNSQWSGSGVTVGVERMTSDGLNCSVGGLTGVTNKDAILISGGFSASAEL